MIRLSKNIKRALELPVGGLSSLMVVQSCHKRGDGLVARGDNSAESGYCKVCVQGWKKKVGR